MIIISSESVAKVNLLVDIHLRSPPEKLVEHVLAIPIFVEWYVLKISRRRLDDALNLF